jgi:hypothetical protein
MNPQTLAAKWGSKDIWLRALFVRAALIWLFRDELTDLQLGRLTWLAALLENAYILGKAQASGFPTAEEAFRQAVEAMRRDIASRIGEVSADAELDRLQKIACDARAVDPLKIIFGHLAGNTKRIYGANRTRTVDLKREWLISHPRGEPRSGQYADDYHINAETYVKGSTATVELQIFLDHFDVFSLLAVPMLLTHELVAHTQAREDRNDDNSIWAEGVMDWVSFFFFERWAPKVDLPLGLMKAHGEQLAKDRMFSPRDTGRIAADNFVQWLTLNPSVQREPVAKYNTARLALQVNVIDRPLPEKDRFASRMANIRRDAALQQGVTDWLHDHATAADLLG